MNNKIETESSGHNSVHCAGHNSVHCAGHNSVHCDANKIPGWNEELESAFSVYQGSYIPGRVASRHKTVCEVLISGAIVQAGISGALQKIEKQPVVGDFVVLLDQIEKLKRMYKQAVHAIT
jgi:ribosome biogenesis GTPase